MPLNSSLWVRVDLKNSVINSFVLKFKDEYTCVSFYCKPKKYECKEMSKKDVKVKNIYFTIYFVFLFHLPQS